MYIIQYSRLFVARVHCHNHWGSTLLTVCCSLWAVNVCISSAKYYTTTVLHHADDSRSWATSLTASTAQHHQSVKDFRQMALPSSCSWCHVSVHEDRRSHAEWMNMSHSTSATLASDPSGLSCPIIDQFRIAFVVWPIYHTSVNHSQDDQFRNVRVVGTGWAELWTSIADRSAHGASQLHGCG